MQDAELAERIMNSTSTSGPDFNSMPLDLIHRYLDISERVIRQVAQEYLNEQHANAGPVIQDKAFYEQAENILIDLEMSIRNVQSQEELDGIVAGLSERLFEIGVT